MKILTLIYWVRAVLGLVIGILCGLHVFYFAIGTQLGGIYTLLTGLSFALLFYMATYYIVKLRFFGRVEKVSKLVTQGIGIYFFAWLVSWTLFVTLLMPSISVGMYYGTTSNLFEDEPFWVAALNSDGRIIQNVTTKSGSLKMALLPPGTYTLVLTGIPEGYTAANKSLTLSWLEFPHLRFNVNVNVTQLS